MPEEFHHCQAVSWQGQVDLLSAGCRYSWPVIERSSSGRGRRKPNLKGLEGRDKSWPLLTTPDALELALHLDHLSGRTQPLRQCDAEPMEQDALSLVWLHDAPKPDVLPVHEWKYDVHAFDPS